VERATSCHRLEERKITQTKRKSKKSSADIEGEEFDLDDTGGAEGANKRRGRGRGLTSNHCPIHNSRHADSRRPRLRLAANKTVTCVSYFMLEKQ